MCGHNASNSSAVNGDYSVALNHSTNNGTINITINNYAFHFPPDVVYHGSKEEQTATCQLLFSPEFAAALKEREEQDPDKRESLSSLLFRMLKSGKEASPQLKNLVVTDDRVFKLVGPGQLASEPRKQYVKKAVGEMHHMIDYVAKLPHKPELNQAKQEIEAKVFAVGKKKRVAMRDVATMQATGDPEMYRLDEAGKKYIEKTRAEQDRHLQNMKISP